MLSVREYELNDIELIVDYFYSASPEFIRGMGADKNKLPKRSEWINKLRSEKLQSYNKMTNFYLIWERDGKPVGHSNINQISFQSHAYLHLHLWNVEKRKKGIGLEFLEKSIPVYFKRFKLQTLICEPYSLNPAPNKILKKAGFEFVRTYETTPGFIN